jgi:hypothetical protein
MKPLYVAFEGTKEGTKGDNKFAKMTTAGKK